MAATSAVAQQLDGAEEDARDGIAPADLKIILLGDSAVGKSKLVERFLMDNYHPRQRSTYALTLYRHDAEVDDVEGGAAGEGASAGASAAATAGVSGGRKRKIAIDFWDTAGQERFASMHASYYYRAHACVLVFDVTRKTTYTNLVQWYTELRQFCPHIPCICIANKIDVDYAVTSKAFAFPKKENLPFFFVSAADGTNVVAIFEEAIRLGWANKTRGEKDFAQEVLDLIDDVRGSRVDFRVSSARWGIVSAPPPPPPLFLCRRH
jgi:Rab-like protein 2